MIIKSKIPVRAVGNGYYHAAAIASVTKSFFGPHDNRRKAFKVFREQIREETFDMIYGDVANEVQRVKQALVGSCRTKKKRAEIEAAFELLERLLRQ